MNNPTYLSHKAWNLYHPKDPVRKGDGYHIHHKDRNTFNNAKNNLEKLNAHQHLSLHKSGEHHHYYGKPGFFSGKAHTDETKTILKKKSKRAWKRGDFNNRINGMQGKEPWNKGKEGHKHTEETRLKMSQTRKGRKLTEEHKHAISEALKRRKQ